MNIIMPGHYVHGKKGYRREQKITLFLTTNQLNDACIASLIVKNSFVRAKLISEISSFNITITKVTKVKRFHVIIFKCLSFYISDLIYTKIFYLQKGLKIRSCVQWVNKHQV